MDTKRTKVITRTTRSAHADSVILVRNGLTHSPFTQISETYLQASGILVSLNIYTNLIFSSTYCSPGPKITIDNFNNFFKTLGKYFIVVGDLNAKHSSWGCFATNTRGRTLLRAIDNSNIQILSPPLPTYWPSHQTRRPDILDIFIAKIPSNYNLNVSKINYLSSDHLPIILEFNSPPSNNLVKNPQLPEKIDWPILERTIETRTQLNPSLKSNENIDASILKLTTDIHECLQLATTPNSTHTTNYPLPNHIKYLIREKRKARSRWQSHKYPPDKLIYNQLKNKLSKALLQHSSSTYNNYIQNLTSQNSLL